MTVSFYVTLPSGGVVKLRSVQEALGALDGEHKLYLLLASSLHPSIAAFLENDLHEGVTASAFDGLKGSHELVDEGSVLVEDEPVHFYRKGVSCFFVTLLLEEPDTVAVRLKYGSCPQDVDLALDLVKTVMREAGTSEFTCEESGDDKFTEADFATKFGAEKWKSAVGEMMSRKFMKRPAPGNLITLIAPRRTFYLGHYSWAKIHEAAGGETATPTSFMRALHQAIRALHDFDAEEEGYYQNMGIFIRKPQGTVSVGSWSPDVSYFMRPFTYISFSPRSGGEETITFNYRDLPMVAGKYATLLDELHILLQRVPEEDVEAILANARTVETEI